MGVISFHSFTALRRSFTCRHRGLILFPGLLSTPPVLPRSAASERLLHVAFAAVFVLNSYSHADNSKLIEGEDEEDETKCDKTHTEYEEMLQLQPQQLF